MGEFEEILAVERDCFGNSWTADMLKSELESALSLCVIEKRADRIVAFALGRVAADEGELYQIGTSSGFRGQGIAAKLLNQLHDEMRKRGAEKCFLEVRSRNAGAISLYRKAGYERVSVRRGYYADDDAIVMRKLL